MDRLRAPVPAAIWVNIKRVEAQVGQAIRKINPLPTGHTTTLTTRRSHAKNTPPATGAYI
jgi:hypothetical protein